MEKTISGLQAIIDSLTKLMMERGDDVRAGKLAKSGTEFMSDVKHVRRVHFSNADGEFSVN